jgi:hypothetical protein
VFTVTAEVLRGLGLVVEAGVTLRIGGREVELEPVTAADYRARLGSGDRLPHSGEPRLVVLTSRVTSSAAMQLVVDLERRTPAVFVGGRREGARTSTAMRSESSYPRAASLRASPPSRGQPSAPTTSAWPASPTSPCRSRRARTSRATIPCFARRSTPS